MKDDDCCESEEMDDHDEDDMPVASPDWRKDKQANNAHSPGKTPDGKVVFSRED